MERKHMSAAKMARSAAAEAIHPGYGFLPTVIDAGLIWVGRSPASIAAMGMKDAAKRLMIDAGVPMTPGYLGEGQYGAMLQAEASAIGP
jgi:3-methylcrotonyl-CoA carboxylase alpha subunit